MGPTTRTSSASRAAAQVLGLPELWTLIAEHCGFIGTFRLILVRKDASQGAKEWLLTLPRLVVCSGRTPLGNRTSEVWRLSLMGLRWERLGDLTCTRDLSACCTVKGRVVVVGGKIWKGDHHLPTAEISGRDDEAQGSIFELLPALSYQRSQYRLRCDCNRREHERIGAGSPHRRSRRTKRGQ